MNKKLKMKINNVENKNLILFEVLEEANEEPIKTFEFDPKSSETINIKEMFDYILDNINCDWIIDDSLIDSESDSTINKLALKYSETLSKEINDIKKEILNML